jgi:hypothetical protein
MRNIGIILFALTAFMLVQCNNKTVKNTEEIKEEIEEKACSHVSIDIFKTDENEDKREFPSVPEELHLHIDEVTFTEGSVSSLSFYSTDSIDSANYKLRIFLPAGEKLQFHDDYDGEISVITDGFPAHILGEDYKAFNNALDETPNEPKAVFEVYDYKIKEFDYIIFTLKGLIIYSLGAEDYKISGEFDFHGVSERNYSCAIKLHVFDEELDMMMVD